VLHQFARISKRQFLLNVCLVRLHRFRADVQFVGDLPRPVPGADQPENFELAIML
jgi:hypothetical protein